LKYGRGSRRREQPYRASSVKENEIRSFSLRGSLTSNKEKKLAKLAGVSNS
jgi:hypothetical protein